MATASHTRRVRFGAFEADLRSGELFKYGIRIKVQDQPFQILAMLLDRPGELVSREELHRRLWTQDTFVDFDAGLNAAMRRLRDALNDSADQPRYIETLPRHGYRFIGQVEKSAELPLESAGHPPKIEPVIAAEGAIPESLFPDVAVPGQKGSRIWFNVAVSVAVLVGIAVLVVGGRQRLFRTHAASPVRSIAVLPLQNMSGDPAQDYFADGMTDALITYLARAGSLRVISRDSVMRYKDNSESPKTVARELGVDAVVEGSVVRAGNRVRINARLIDVSSGRTLWASAFERDASDVLALQDEAAVSIAKEIAANLTPNEKPGMAASTRTVNPAAYEAYLKGKYFSAKQSDEGFEKAKAYFNESIKLDPTYAPAYVGLAEVFGWLGFSGRRPATEAWSEAENLLAKALALDEASPEAHTLVGMSRLLYRCDQAGGEKELNRALELDPANMNAHNYHSYYLLSIGRSNEAIAEKEMVLGRDPISVSINAELGLYFLEAGRNDEAIAQLKKTLELDSNFAPAHMRLGLAYFNKGRVDDAVAEMKTAVSEEKTPTRLGTLGNIYYQVGRIGDFQNLIQELEEMSAHRYVSPSLIASMYARIGNADKAFAWLSRANSGDEPGIDGDSFNALRTDPRFVVQARRLKSKDSCP